MARHADPECTSEYPGTLTRMHQVAARFDAAWQAALQGGSPPRIEDYLGDNPGPQQAALLRELLAVEFECRRRRGERPTAEDYRRRLPDHVDLIIQVLHELESSLGCNAEPPPDQAGVDPAGPANRDAVAQHKEEARPDQSRLADLLVRWEELRSQCPTISAREFCEREGFPELVDEMQRRIQELESVAALLRTTDWPEQSVPGVTNIIQPKDQTPNVSGGLISTTASYRIIDSCGKGGMGEVFVAQDVQLRRGVALKLIQSRRAHDSYSRNRFLREAEVTARLEHPGVVPVYTIGQDPEGRPCYAMRFIQGETLDHAITGFHDAERPGQDPGERCLAFRQLLTQFLAICNTIAYAHSRGILHRDLKPLNVMLGKYGETLVVDRGLAKSIDRDEAARASGEETLDPQSGSQGSETLAGSALGTPAYMSPEQAGGLWEGISPASDIYSLGAILYRVLAGQPPFRHPDVNQIIAKVMKGDFPPPRQAKKDVPPALEAICLKAMALEPKDRYRTALDLAADIEHWLADEPVSVYREPWVERLARWARRHRTWMQAAAASLVVVTAVAVLAALAIDSARRKELQANEEALAWLNANRETVTRVIHSTSELGQLAGAETAQLRLLDAMASSLTEMSERTASDDPRLMIESAWLRLNMARVQETLGYLDKANENLALAEEIFDGLPGQQKPLHVRYAQATCSVDRGIIREGQGQDQEALEAYHTAK